MEEFDIPVGIPSGNPKQFDVNLVELYRHSFLDYTIDEILDGSPLEEKHMNIIHTIEYFEQNWRNEFASSIFNKIEISQFHTEIYTTAHGYVQKSQLPNINTRVAALTNTKHIVSLALLGTYAYYFKEITRIIEQELYRNSIGVEHQFSMSGKDLIRQVYSNKLFFYKELLINRIANLKNEKINHIIFRNELRRNIEELNNTLEKIENHPDITKAEQTIFKYNETIDTVSKDIKNIENATEEWSRELLKSFNRDSLITLNTQLENMGPNDSQNLNEYDNGIDIIPKPSEQMYDLFMIFCEEKFKTGDPDKEYYRRLHSVLQSNPFNTIDELFEQIINERTYAQPLQAKQSGSFKANRVNQDPTRQMQQFYAFNVNKTGTMGSFIYEIVKKCVMQSKNENTGRFFYTCFSVDNLGLKVAHDTGSSLIREANNGRFFVEIVRMLEILNCVGPHNLTIGSCQTTVGDVDELRGTINSNRENTQESQDQDQEQYFDQDQHQYQDQDQDQYQDQEQYFDQDQDQYQDQIPDSKKSTRKNYARKKTTRKTHDTFMHNKKRFERVGTVNTTPIYGKEHILGYYIKNIENQKSPIRVYINKNKNEFEIVKPDETTANNFLNTYPSNLKKKRTLKNKKGGKRKHTR